jgi:hypothetical protein
MVLDLIDLGKLSYSVVNCTSYSNWHNDSFCLIMVLLSVFCLITWSVGVASTVRILIISKNKLNFNLLVHFGLLLSNTSGCLYVLVYDIFLLRYFNEIINSTVMFAFVGYFLLSIIRFRIFPGMFSSLIVSFY